MEDERDRLAGRARALRAAGRARARPAAGGPAPRDAGALGCRARRLHRPQPPHHLARPHRELLAQREPPIDPGQPDAWTESRRMAANLEAMQLLVSKPAGSHTVEDRRVLARYSGWGGLSIDKAQAAFPPSLQVDTRDLIHAYYTPSPLVAEIARVTRPLARRSRRPRRRDPGARAVRRHRPLHPRLRCARRRADPLDRGRVLGAGRRAPVRRAARPHRVHGPLRALGRAALGRGGRPHQPRRQQPAVRPARRGGVRGPRPRATARRPRWPTSCGAASICSRPAASASSSCRWAS
jgi:hypothetical protein